MRMQVEVGREDEDPLRTLAVNDRRSLREQASFLLHVKIREEIARLGLTVETDSVAEVA
jgi:hypothetical protein